MNKPLISVIMSVYKEPLDWICQSVDSILSQTHANIELFIVCDNPEYKDGLALLKDYEKRDMRVSVIFNENNIGLTCSLNKAIAYTHGEYIARMDADDISMPERFEKQIDYFHNNPDCELCHTGCYVIDESGSIKKDNPHHATTTSADYLVWQNIIAHPSVMMRRGILSRRSPLYNEEYRRAQDYELWSYLFSQGVDFGFIDEPLVKYRQSSAQITKIHGSEQYALFHKARLSLVIELLSRLCIPVSQDNSAIEFIKRIEIKDNISSVDRNAVARLKYLLYYNLVQQHKVLLFYYLVDSCHFSKTIGRIWFKQLLAKAFNVSDLPAFKFNYKEIIS